MLGWGWPMNRPSSQPWPWNKIRPPRPADWGVSMTVCIASRTAEDSYVLVSDMMLSIDYASGDWMGTKQRGIGKRWRAMMAGNDVSQATPILDSVAERVYGSDGSLREVAKVFEDEFSAQRRSVAEAKILSPYGLTIAELLKSRESLGDTLFNQLSYQVSAERLDVEFLVAGFDEDGAFHLFGVSDPGVISYWDLPGFWAIGSGATAALGSLFNSGHTRYKNTHSALYNLCSAKFAAESATGVGKGTAVGVFYQDRRFAVMMGSELDPIRKLWEKH